MQQGNRGHSSLEQKRWYGEDDFAHGLHIFELECSR